MVPGALGTPLSYCWNDPNIRKLPAVPTPEIAAAFKKLEESHVRLTEVSRQLYEAIARGPSVGDPLYKELTEEWEQALREMKSAISAVIELLRVE